MNLQNFGLGITISILIFPFCIYIIRWNSKRRKERSNQLWDATKISLIWLAINSILAIIYSFMIEDMFIYFLILISSYILCNLFVFSLIEYYFQGRKFTESIKFALIIQLYLFGVNIILGFLIALINGYLYPQFSNALFFVLENGLIYTLFITAVSLASGFVLGLTLAIMRVYGGIELNWLANGYEKIFRGIPLLVLIFIFAFGLPGIFWYLDPLDRLLASVILALGIRSGAYQSQIFRGAILSINPGQMEAAQSLGMSRMQSFRHIILPQALRISIPGWSNEYAVVIKDSSFAGAVGTFEMTFAAYIWGFRSVELFTLSMGVVAILYFLFTFPITRLFGERQTKKLKELGMGG
jgi:polar amino acid transport system permease protein